MKEKNNAIYKRALALAVPMMIQNGITNMVGLIDNVMVGSLGIEMATAVSIVGQLIFVFNLAIFGGVSGPGIYGAQYYGKGDIEGFRSTFRMKIWICAACLGAALLIFNLKADFLIGLYLHGESESVNVALTMENAKDYLAIMLWGLLPFVITQIYAGSLRETGNSITPMAAGVASVAVDIVFNYFLIFGKFGFPEMGIKGAAAATVLSRIAECLIVVITSTVKRKKYTFLQGIYKTLLVPRQTAIIILKKGLPIFLNEFFWAGGTAALTQSYSMRGLDIVAGINISNILCNILNVVFIAMGNAVGILIGQSLGASQYAKAKDESFRLTLFSGGICVILTVILISVSGAFPRLYNTTEEIRGIAAKFIVITALFFPVQGLLNSLYFTIRSGGKTLVTFLFDSVFTCAAVLPAAYLLCRFSTLSIFAIYVIVMSMDIIKVVIGSVMIKKGIWISNIVGDSPEAIKE